MASAWTMIDDFHKILIPDTTCSSCTLKVSKEINLPFKYFPWKKQSETSMPLPCADQSDICVTWRDWGSFMKRWVEPGFLCSGARKPCESSNHDTGVMHLAIWSVGKHVAGICW